MHLPLFSIYLPLFFLTTSPASASGWHVCPLIWATLSLLDGQVLLSSCELLKWCEEVCITTTERNPQKTRETLCPHCMVPIFTRPASWSHLTEFPLIGLYPIFPLAIMPHEGLETRKLSMLGLWIKQEQIDPKWPIGLWPPRECVSGHVFCDFFWC